MVRVRVKLTDLNPNPNPDHNQRLLGRRERGEEPPLILCEGREGRPPSRVGRCERQLLRGLVRVRAWVRVRC